MSAIKFTWQRRAIIQGAPERFFARSLFRQRGCKACAARANRKRSCLAMGWSRTQFSRSIYHRDVMRSPAARGSRLLSRVASLCNAPFRVRNLASPREIKTSRAVLYFTGRIAAIKCPRPRCSINPASTTTMTIRSATTATPRRKARSASVFLLRVVINIYRE